MRSHGEVELQCEEKLCLFVTDLDEKALPAHNPVGVDRHQITYRFERHDLGFFGATKLDPPVSG